MLVRFTKKADGRHRLTIVRDHGSVSQGQVIPGLGPNAILTTFFTRWSRRRSASRAACTAW
jgi:hypothetical protein